MSLKTTAEIDRPRKKLISNGPQGLLLTKLGAVIIGRGTVRNDALMIGKVVEKILMRSTYEATIA